MERTEKRQCLVVVVDLSVLSGAAALFVLAESSNVAKVKINRCVLENDSIVR